jgi:hypothetical protein
LYTSPIGLPEKAEAAFDMDGMGWQSVSARDAKRIL